jgi:hypothetical protein
LIQILCIKAAKPVDVELGGAKAGRVNLNRGRAKRPKPASGHAAAGFALAKSVDLLAPGLYGALTLSAVSGKSRSRALQNLAKPERQRRNRRIICPGRPSAANER